VVVIGVILSLYFAATSLLEWGLSQAAVEEVGFDESEFFLYYTAIIRAGGEDVRSLYVRVPKPGLRGVPLLVMLGWRKESRVKSIEVQFTTPQREPVDLAWVSTTITAPVEFYKEGAVVTWRCRDLGVFGKATVTLEFIPALPADLASSRIHVKAIVEYKGLNYVVEHSIIVTSPQILQ